MACVVAIGALTALPPGSIHGETMIPALPARRVLIETTETLAIALAGGLTFTYLGLPAGLVSGSVLAVATAALLGRPVRHAASLGALLLRQRRHSARRRGDAGDAARRDHVAGEHRAADAVHRRHDAGDVELSARRAPLGSALRALGRQSRRHGAGDRIVVGARRRSARHRHRADHARVVDRHRPAERACFVRAGGAGGRGGARPGRRLRARANDPLGRGLGRLRRRVSILAIPGRADVRRADRIGPAARHRLSFMRCCRGGSVAAR